jgi:hypothetical protein
MESEACPVIDRDQRAERQGAEFVHGLEIIVQVSRFSSVATAKKGLGGGSKANIEPPEAPICRGYGRCERSKPVSSGRRLLKYPGSMLPNTLFINCERPFFESAKKVLQKEE